MKKNNRFLRGIGKVLFFIYDFIGLRYIKNMIITPKDETTGKRKPITFFLWFVGIYIALFGIASQRYESRVNVIEDRISSIITGLNAPQYKKALSRIAGTQTMTCPIKPDILKPYTTFISLFRNEVYNDGVEILKSIIENWSDHLAQTELTLAKLDYANLNGANLSGAYMTWANLIQAKLQGADLSGAHLREADLSGADLTEANLTEADLTGADLSWAYLTGADVTKADLSGTDLSWAFLPRVNLTGARLYGANLKHADLSGDTIELFQLKLVISLDQATMMDGTPYDESWAERINQAYEGHERESGTPSER